MKKGTMNSLNGSRTRRNSPFRKCCLGGGSLTAQLVSPIKHFQVPLSLSQM